MARLLFCERIVFKGSEGKTFVEMCAFEVEFSCAFPDGVKYSLSLVHKGECVLRYDNEREKGHHRHFEGKEVKIKFKSIERLVEEFLKEVESLRKTGVLK